MIEQFFKAERSRKLRPLARFVLLHTPLKVCGITHIIPAITGLQDVDEVLDHKNRRKYTGLDPKRKEALHTPMGYGNVVL